MLKQLWKELSTPHAQLCSFLLRVGLGTIFIWHGILKLVLNHGRGWDVDLPEFTQVAVAWGETLCGFALLLGLLSRLAALGVMVIMLGAILLTPTSSFLPAPSAPAVGTIPRKTHPVGAEYNFALIVMALGVISLGSDPLALDHLIFGRRKRRPQPGPAKEPETAAASDRPRVGEAAGLPGEG